jgi:serine/threonine-protein kinase RsbW
MEAVLHLPVAPNVELVAAKAVETVGGALGMSRSRVEAASVAVVEACLNAMEHGGGTMVVRLSGDRANGRPRLVIEVEDNGHGFEAAAIAPRRPARELGAGPRRGWGLTLIRELMDEVQITSRPGLTLVRMLKYVENGP